MKSILTSSSSAKGSNFHYYYLPMGVITLTVKEIWKKGNRSFGISLSQKLIPDPAHRYYLTYQSSGWYEDKVNIDFNPDGFLQRVHTVSEDKTGAVIDKIGELATVIAQATVMPMVGERDLVRKPDGEYVVYTATFDPFGKGVQEMLNRELVKYSPELRLHLKHLKSDKPESLVGSFVGNERKGNGVFCKPLTVCQLIFQNGDIVHRQLIHLPDPNEVHCVAIPRNRMVRTAFTMEFQQGYPKQIQYEKPSSALAIIESPVRLLKSIVSIPAQLFKFRLDWSNNRTGLLASEQRANTLEAKQEREERLRQQKLDIDAARLEKDKMMAERENMRLRAELERMQRYTNQSNNSGASNTLGGSGTQTDLQRAREEINRMRNELNNMNDRSSGDV